ncbi:MAG: Methylase involved in ubiquinone/menaquinone biosynthesis, partial [Dehalococcoidia bacterium]|nr:Methylase involved in ubiquinone/menaquinone biosynthesis [Dehalococcoidia bacterium]
DFVICNGVLHHTSDPFRGFQSIAQLVKPGGFIIVGLYNKYGRISTDIRRFIFRLSGDRFKFLDTRLMAKDVSDTRKHTWFMDQYKHPHESKHTLGEVLGWFEQTGFEFINSIPKSTASAVFSSKEKLLAPNPKGSAIDRFLVQFGMLISGGKEGGFFVMIGRKSQSGPFSDSQSAS